MYYFRFITCTKDFKFVRLPLQNITEKSSVTFLLCAFQMAFQGGAYPGRYACNNRTTLAYSWLDSRQNFNFASFPPRYSRTSTYDNCAHDSVYVRKPVLMDYKLLPYSPIQANVSFVYLEDMCSWIFIFPRRICNQPA